jgi:ubiquinone/menaquinone biosynthesis C-methylase UbiE
MNNSRNLPTTLAVVLITLLTPGAARAQGTISSQRIFDAIGAGEGSTVCEIGAGDGELTAAAARAAGPTGRVLASELGEERIKTLRDTVSSSGLANVTVVAGDATKTNFPDGGCDALFLRNVYHHFADPAAMTASILAALRPGGRVAVVDFTPPDKEAPKPADRGLDGMHGVLPETVVREMIQAGFETVSSETAQRALMVVMSKPKR